MLLLSAACIIMTDENVCINEQKKYFVPEISSIFNPPKNSKMITNFLITSKQQQEIEMVLAGINWHIRYRGKGRNEKKQRFYVQKVKNKNNNRPVNEKLSIFPQKNFRTSTIFNEYKIDIFKVLSKTVYTYLV